jgi:hypothetical protein
LADRFGEWIFLSSGLAAQTAGLLWLARTARPDLPYAQLLPSLIISGIGISMTLPAAQKAAVGAVSAAEIGQASGAFNALRQIGGAAGIAVVAAVFSRSGGYASAQQFIAGFTPAIAAAAAIALLGAMITVIFRRGSISGKELRSTPGNSVVDSGGYRPSDHRMSG